MALVSHVGTTLQARVAVDVGWSLCGVIKFQGATNTAIETMVDVLLLCASMEHVQRLGALRSITYVIHLG